MPPLTLENGALDARAVRRHLEAGMHVALGRLHAAPNGHGGCRVWSEGQGLFDPDRTILESVTTDEAALFFAQCWDNLLLSGVRNLPSPRGDLEVTPPAVPGSDSTGSC